MLLMLTSCLILAAVSAKKEYLLRRIVILSGKLAVNSFCPASLYEKHLYYYSENKEPAVILFGNVFPIVRFLSIESGEEDEYGKDIEFLKKGSRDTAVVVNASAAVENEGQNGVENDKEQSTSEVIQNGENNENSGSGQDNGEQEEDSTTQSDTQQDSGQQDISATGQDVSEVISRAGLSISTKKAYSFEQLVNYDFVHSSFYIIPSHTSLSKDILNPEELINTDLKVSGDRPCILLYHTHSQEAFADSKGGEMTIVQVGDYLEQILTQKYGYEVIHVRTEFDMVDGQLDRGKAYTYAEQEIGKILSENPQIDMVIDLHRDGVQESLHFVTEINGKPTAKIMLFNGISYSNNQGNIDYLYNPYLKDNLALTYQMYALGKTYYPDFIRCIYIEAYRYNLHLCRRSMLIEAGAQTNTFEEVKNAMEPLAELIVRELGGERIY